MPSFGFQAQFADDVENEIKHQTIRAKRKHRPRVGQTAHCFTGMRTTKCRRLGRWPILGVHDIEIYDEGVRVNGQEIRAEHLDDFAREDGFAHWPGMLVWFARSHGLPFHGDLVMW